MPIILEINNNTTVEVTLSLKQEVLVQQLIIFVGNNPAFDTLVGKSPTLSQFRLWLVAAKTMPECSKQRARLLHYDVNTNK